MDEKQLLAQLATKLFNKSEDELRTLIYEGEEIKDNAFDNLLQLDAARVKRFKDNETQRFDDGYKKAQKEIMPEIERKLKAEFEITDDLQFDELLPKVKEKIQSGSKSKLTDDDVKKHPLFIDLEKNRVPKDAFDQKVKEFDDYKAGIERKTKLDRVKEKAILHLEEFKPDYPDVPAIKQNLINVYLREFEALDYEIAQDGSIIAIRDGKRIEDAHGNIVPFDQLAKQTASGYFKFLQQTPKGGAGNGKPGQPGQPHSKKYATEEELTKAYEAATTDEERKEILRANGLLK